MRNIDRISNLFSVQYINTNNQCAAESHVDASTTTTAAEAAAAAAKQPFHSPDDSLVSIYFQLFSTMNDNDVGHLQANLQVNILGDFLFVFYLAVFPLFIIENVNLRFVIAIRNSFPTPRDRSQDKFNWIRRIFVFILRIAKS